MNDNINHPDHYQGSIETIDVIAAMGPDYIKGFCLGNAVKYISRWERKNGIEDLKKAQFYLNWFIEYLEKANERP